MAETGSFIPKQSNQKVTNRRTKKRIYLLGYISYVLFFGTLLAVAGMFAYELQLNSSLDRQKGLLAEERSSFSQSDIERVREFEQRLLAADLILNQHVAVSRVFDALELVTISPVSFSAFTIDLVDADGGLPLYELALSGMTESFNDLLFQRSVLNSDPTLETALIKGVTYGAAVAEADTTAEASSDSIIFSVEATLPVDLIAYRAPQQPVGQTVQVEDTATTSLETVTTDDVETTESVTNQ